MKSRILSWGIFLALIFTAKANAQSQFRCGVSVEDGRAIAIHRHEAQAEVGGQVQERSAITYVPVRFFLVADGNGEGRPSEKLALSALCLLNEHYADQDIQFYLKQFKYYNNTTVYSNPTSAAGGNLIAGQMNNNYNAINIFIVDEMAEDGVLAYYQPPPGPNGNDWIVSLSNYVDETLVLTHEVGHFFSLNHTFYGWESSGGWNPVIHGNPVGPYSPDGVLNELVNGSNCTVAGDEICDTPADYMFPDNNCSYTLNAKDPNGVAVDPDIQNFMNYVYGCDNYHFTDQQKDAINNSLFSSARNYIRPNYTPNTAIVSGTPTIISPQQSETIDTYNAVPLEWTALPGADKYLIELTTSGQPVKRIIVTSNSTVLTDLLPNKSYLWKVLGYNEYSTCGGFSTQKIFKTGGQLSDTSVALGLQNWEIAPNPVRIGSPIVLNVESTANFTADIKLSNLNGQLVQEIRERTFATGVTAEELSTLNIEAGVYLVTLISETGAQTKRVSVVH